VDRIPESAVPGDRRSRHRLIHAVMRRAALFLAVAIVLSACRTGDADIPIEPGTAPQVVVVSISTIASLVEPLLDPHTGVIIALPSGADPATWSPTDDDIQQMARADLVVTAGLPFEKLLLDRMRDAGADPAVTGSSTEPFFWLGFDGAREITRSVTTELIAAQPGRAAELLRRMENEIEVIDRLQEEIAESLEPLAGSTVFVSRPVFVSLLADYDIRQDTSRPGGAGESDESDESDDTVPPWIVIQPEALAPTAETIPFSPWQGPWDATIRSAVAAIGAGISP